MRKIESICPECGKQNDFYLSKNAEQLEDFEAELENEPDDSNLKNTVEDFKARQNQNEVCSECLQNLIECPCGYDYDIRGSKNWLEIKSIIDSYD